MFDKFRKDVRFGGVINIIIYIVVNIYIQYHLTTKSSAFDGFKLYHHILWYSLLIIQNVFIVKNIYNPKIDDSYMNQAIYEFFTKGGIKSYQNILVATEIEPLFEYFVLFVFILIPWPIFKTITLKRRFLLVFAKIGIFHFVSSLVLLNWKTHIVNYKKR